MARPLRRLLACALVPLALVATAHAATATPPVVTPLAPKPIPMPPGGIIGGQVAPKGAWPSQVSVQWSHLSGMGSHRCGGTVVSPSWVLTAAHCVVHDGTRTLYPAITWRVRASGSGDLSVPGWTSVVSEVRVRPDYSSTTIAHDIALLRLATPLPTPVARTAPPGTVIAAGTASVASGWGSVDPAHPAVTKALRQVSAPVWADQSCGDKWGPYHTASRQLCAGNADTTTCQGDSGGPLWVKLADGWSQVGIVSFGVSPCGRDGIPTVFTRVSAYQGWIDGHIRYGPHGDAKAFVKAAYNDLFGRQPVGTELSAGVSALGSQSPTTWLGGLLGGTTWQRRAGGTARLYRAYFGRDADTAGLRYWIAKQAQGASLDAVSASFTKSAEFTKTYGKVGDAAFVTLVYQHVLGHAPDAAGQAYWTGQLASHARTRGEVMTGFSESPEYKAATKARTGVTTTTFALLRRTATTAEIAKWAPQAPASLVRTLLGSYSYHSRF